MEHSGRNRHGQKGFDYGSTGYERTYSPATKEKTDVKRHGAEAFSSCLLIQTVAAAIIFGVMTVIRLVSAQFYSDIESGITGSPLGNMEIGTLTQQAVDYIRESETFAELFGTGKATESESTPVFTPQSRSGAEGDGAIFRTIPERSEAAPDEADDSEFDIMTYKPALPGRVCCPAPYTEITSRFGERHDPFSNVTVFHNGLDLAMEEGTVVRAFLDGEVRLVGEDEIGGKYLVITHSDGFESYYGHLSQINVKEGQSVLTCEAVALSGNSGRTTGAHLHFELIKDGQSINPEPYIDV